MLGPSVLFDCLVELFLAGVVLLHDDFFFVAAQHWQVGLHVHWVVDSLLEGLQPHFMHFVQDVILREAETVGSTCFVRQLVERHANWLLNDGFISSWLRNGLSRKVNFVSIHIMQLLSCLVSQLNHVVTIERILRQCCIATYNKVLVVNRADIHVCSGATMLPDGICQDVAVNFTIFSRFFVLLHYAQRRELLASLVEEWSMRTVHDSLSLLGSSILLLAG